MSGGSYNYAFHYIDEEYVGKMYDSQLNEMMKDLVKVLYDLEWWRSGDINEEEYRQTVTKFKRKWFNQTKVDVEKLVEREFEVKKNELLKQLEYLNDSYEGFENTK